MNKELVRREWLERAEKVEFGGTGYLAIGDIDLYLCHINALKLFGARRVFLMRSLK